MADPATVARRVFSDAALAGLARLDSEAWHTRFYELWTLGEAYIKARGLGLTIDLRKFTFRVDEKTGVRVEFEDVIEDDEPAWQFWLWRPGDGYQGALALPSLAHVTDHTRIAGIQSE